MIRTAVRKLRNLMRRSRTCSKEAPGDIPGNLTPPPPSVIFIIINDVCNLRCKMCDVGQKNRESQFYQVMAPQGGEALDMAGLRKLIGEVKDFKPTIAVTSTEPLLFKDLFQFAREVKRAGLFSQVTTNGLLLPRCAEEVVESGVDPLWVSLDGPRDVHNEIRGHPESFQRATEGLLAVHRLARARGKAIQLCVNYSYSNHNCAALVDFLESIRDLPVENVSISHMNYVTEEMADAHNELYGDYCRATPSSVVAADPLAVDVDRMWETIQEAKEREWPFALSFSPDFDEQGLRDFYYHPEVIVRARKCPAPWNLAQLAANGDWVISTRCFLKVMGNLNEETFMETWHGKKYQKFRRWILENTMSPACTRCCAVL